jgi:hypothetical protein
MRGDYMEKMVTLSKEELNEILQCFNELVKEGRYKKIAYSIWKYLINLDKAEMTLCYNYIDINSYIQLSVFGDSLGTYLYEVYFNKGESTNYLTSAIGNTTPTQSVTTATSITDTKHSNDFISNQAPLTLNDSDVWNFFITPDKDEGKEKDKMKGFNFDFGPCTGDSIRMSMYGLAVKNAAGVYVSYDVNSQEIIDVDILNFDGGKYMYKIPVAINDVAIGDVIIHARKPMFVIGASEDGLSIKVIDVIAGEEKKILPTKSPFGFNFVTKIVSLFNMMGTNVPTKDQPFGNMLPLLMMQGDDIDPLVLMLATGGKMDSNNSMMMYLLMKGDKDTDSLLPLLMMQNCAK